MTTSSRPTDAEPGRTEESRCRVCGLDEGDERWSASGHPMYVICSACGAESGIEDVSVDSARHHRERWVRGGAVWSWPRSTPSGWSLADQLDDVPPSWR